MTDTTNLVNGGAMPRSGRSALTRDRREFIGGSDARVIMGKDERALLRLWREKRGEEAPPDLSSVLIEPPRDCRRLFCLSHAATAVSAIMA